MKAKCVACGKKLLMTDRRYEVYGNYCNICSGRADNIAKTKASVSSLRIRLRKAHTGKRDMLYIKKIWRLIREAESILEKRKKKLSKLILSAPQYYKGEIKL